MKRFCYFLFNTNVLLDKSKSFVWILSNWKHLLDVLKRLMPFLSNTTHLLDFFKRIVQILSNRIIVLDILKPFQLILSNRKLSGRLIKVLISWRGGFATISQKLLCILPPKSRISFFICHDTCNDLFQQQVVHFIVKRNAKQHFGVRIFRFLSFVPELMHRIFFRCHRYVMFWHAKNNDKRTVICKRRLVPFTFQIQVGKCF